MPTSTDLRLSLLELAHVLDRLLRLYGSRPWRHLEPLYEPDLSRLSTVGELALAQVRGLLDHADDGSAPEPAPRPPFHAPTAAALLYRLELRRQRAAGGRASGARHPRPNA